MYILHKEAAYPLRAIATLIVMSLVLWSLGMLPFGNIAYAANLTSIKDTLSDSDLGVSSNHTFQFTTPSGVLTGQTIVLNFPAGFTNIAALDFGDVDVVASTTEITLAGAPSGATWGVTTSATAVTLTVSGSNVASGTPIFVEIGTNATAGGVGNTQIVNPAVAGSYELTVNGTMSDNGQTRVAIIDDVLVTANVDTQFTFVISGVASGQSVNATGSTTATTTTATTVPFETLTAGQSKVLAQDLAVTTNAINGFVVTVEQSQNLLSSTGADIDGFANGTYTNTPSAWSAPTSNISQENTWGHWGITSEDDLNADEFGSDLWVSASSTPRQVFTHNGPSDGTTPNIGKTRIGYRAQISSLQEAADDYNTTLTFIATPTF
jgi:hypothetical protein